MKLSEMFNLAVEKGMENDPRGRTGVEEELKKRQEDFEKLNPEEKDLFDQERLINPYDDSRILWGDPDTEIKSILVGIDVDTAELVLADRLKEKGMAVDLVVGHHPEGKALAGLHRVMPIQEDVMFATGVPINIAQGLMIPRIAEVERSVMPNNHNKAVDAARLLNIPFMNFHTPADNCVQKYLEDLLAKKQPKTVGDIVRLLKEIPEYAAAEAINAGPKIVLGDEKRRCGRIMVDMTGGTSGSENAYAKLAEAGVGTIVGMHMGDKHRTEAEKCHINVIIAGHMASDSLGMNLILDSFEAQGIVIEPFAGLIRHSRA
jgi:putative NIF3 family GTP cyclohydrolase 1 type 2